MKKNIIAFIIMGIVFTGIGVLATTAITADQVNYDSNTTVKDKIDDLYVMADLETTIDKKSCDAGENSPTCTINNLDTNKYYFCIATYRGTNPNFTVTNANSIFGEHVWNYLDRYSTYRTFIKPTSSSVTFTATSDYNGMAVVCYHIVNIH